MSNQIVWLHGRRACPCWAAILPGLEADLRASGFIRQDLSGLITQGAYNTSVAASGSTHSGGGVWDVRHSLVDTDAKRRIWLKWGVVPFDRRTADAPVTRWPNHGHMVVAGCPHLAASAARQVTQACLGRNALVGNGPFRGLGGRPKIITYREALAREAKLKRSWFDMASKKDLEEVVTTVLERRAWEKVLPDKHYKKTFPVVANSSWRNNVLHMQQELDTIRSRVTAMESKLDAILKAVSK